MIQGKNHLTDRDLLDSVQVYHYRFHHLIHDIALNLNQELKIVPAQLPELKIVLIHLPGPRKVQNQNQSQGKILLMDTPPIKLTTTI
jgi:hypothetical protein